MYLVTTSVITYKIETVNGENGDKHTWFYWVDYCCCCCMATTTPTIIAMITSITTTTAVTTMQIIHFNCREKEKSTVLYFLLHKA